MCLTLTKLIKRRMTLSVFGLEFSLDLVEYGGSKMINKIIFKALLVSKLNVIVLLL